MSIRTPLIALLAAALALSACAGDSNNDTEAAANDTDTASTDDAPVEDDHAATDDAPAESGQASDGTDAGFPVTIEHRHGETTIDERPERVVTVGLTDHDPVLALGVVPVGTNDWYGGHPGGIWPWAQDLLDGQQPTVIGQSIEIDFEAVAALDPDVILGLYAGLDEHVYETLSGIAPTVAQPADFVDYGVPWQEQTRIVGQVLGMTDEAERIVADAEATVAEPIYTALDVHQQGREVFLSTSGELGGAGFISVLSVPVIAEELAPALAAAVDGDPATEVPPVD